MIGTIESKAKTVLISDSTFREYVDKDNVILNQIVSGLEMSDPYVIIKYNGRNDGPVDTIKVAGNLVVEAWFKHNTMEDVNKVLNRICILLNGTVLAETSYFAQVFYSGSVPVVQPDSFKGWIARGIRFEVHETY